MMMENVVLDGGPGQGYRNLISGGGDHSQYLDDLKVSSNLKESASKVHFTSLYLQVNIVRSRDRLHSAKVGANGQRQRNHSVHDKPMMLPQQSLQDAYSKMDSKVDFNIFHPKITVKPLMQNAAGGLGQVSLTARAQTNPGGKRKKLVKQKKSRDNKEKIYRLPSLSKCLEHEILPKSSMMLKQICEIASQNTGFINSHFEEYIKKKGTQNLNSTTALKPTAGLVAQVKTPRAPNLEVKGLEKTVAL